MKKIYNILFTLIAVLSFTSCSNDIDEVFDKPSAERVNDAIAEYKTCLLYTSDAADEYITV